jgi:hypothetical protein
VFGGSGGTLDRERVEDWGGLFERGKWDSQGGGKYHFGELQLHLSGSDGTQPKRTFTDSEKRGRGQKRDWKRKGEWVYKAETFSDRDECEKRGQRWVEDWVEWRAIDIDGGIRDRIGIVGHACIA